MHAHLSDGAELAMHDVFPLRGIDLFKVSTCICVSTHSLIMYYCILIDAHLSTPMGINWRYLICSH